MENIELPSWKDEKKRNCRVSELAKQEKKKKKEVEGEEGWKAGLVFTRALTIHGPSPTQTLTRVPTPYL